MKIAAPRLATMAVLTLRVAYGAGLVVAPARLARRWLGPAAETGPTQIPLQGLGTRELVLHAGALVAAVQDAPLRPWLIGSSAGDLTDVIATFAKRRQLPAGAAGATVVVAGGSALLSAVLAAAVER
jgi:hypothetical protein